MRSRFEDLARQALLEITPASTVGAVIGETDEGDGVVSVLFESAQRGYPDWQWTVSIAHLDGEEPTVLEAELMPTGTSILAPDWVPWSDRLAEYKAAQAALGLEADAAELDGSDDAAGDDESDDSDDDDEVEDEDSDTDDADDDEDEDDEDDDDPLDSDVLHGGDLDGVDIDDLDDSGADDEDEDEDSDDDSDDEDELDD